MVGLTTEETNAWGLEELNNTAIVLPPGVSMWAPGKWAVVARAAVTLSMKYNLGFGCTCENTVWDERLQTIWVFPLRSQCVTVVRNRGGHNTIWHRRPNMRKCRHLFDYKHRVRKCPVARGVFNLGFYPPPFV